MVSKTAKFTILTALLLVFSMFHAMAQTSPTWSQFINTATLQASYAQGKVIGGLITFANLSSSRTGFMLTTVTADTADAAFASGNLDLILFRQNPSASTVGDGATLAIAAVDEPKRIYTVHLTDCTANGIPVGCQATNLNTEAGGFPLNGPVYGVLVNRASTAVTLTSQAAGELIVSLQGFQN